MTIITILQGVFGSQIFFFFFFFLRKNIFWTYAPTKISQKVQWAISMHKLELMIITTFCEPNGPLSMGFLPVQNRFRGYKCFPRGFPARSEIGSGRKFDFRYISGQPGRFRQFITVNRGSHTYLYSLGHGGEKRGTRFQLFAVLCFPYYSVCNCSQSVIVAFDCHTWIREKQKYNPCRPFWMIDLRKTKKKNWLYVVHERYCMRAPIISPHPSYLPTGGLNWGDLCIYRGPKRWSWRGSDLYSTESQSRGPCTRVTTRSHNIRTNVLWRKGGKKNFTFDCCCFPIRHERIPISQSYMSQHVHNCCALHMYRWTCLHIKKVARRGSTKNWRGLEHRFTNLAYYLVVFNYHQF